MIIRNLAQIASMCKGELVNEKHKDIVIKDFSIDSRDIKASCLFIPIIGENFDGHNFATSAIEQGAAACLWSKDEIPDIDFPFIKVDDTTIAFQNLASAYREEVNPIVIAITGSNGKTTTKDILYSILKTKYKTKKTMGNLNNEIGVPKTILSLDDDTEVIVVEMGIEQPKEMQLIGNIVKPNIAIFTNTGIVHIENFKDTDDIANAKLELMDFIKDKGLALVNIDDTSFSLNLDKHLKDNLKIIKYGFNNPEITKAKIISSSIENKFVYKNIEYICPLLGKHNLYNALSAVIVADYLGLSYENINFGLNNIEKTKMRIDLIDCAGFKILDDSYKSNPNSLLASLDTLSNIPSSRKILVLGDMLGLAEKTAFYHEDIAKKIDSKLYDYIISYGEYSKHFLSGAKENFENNKLSHFNFGEEEKLLELLKSILIKDSIVFLKASRDIHIEKFIPEIKKMSCL